MSSVDIDYGIHKVKLKVARNEKRKNYINTAYFEVFCRKIKLSANLFFLKSRYVDVCTMENITEVGIYLKVMGGKVHIFLEKHARQGVFH